MTIGQFTALTAGHFSHPRMMGVPDYIDEALEFLMDQAAVALPDIDTPFMSAVDYQAMVAAQSLPGGHQSSSLFMERSLTYLAYKLADPSPPTQLISLTDIHFSYFRAVNINDYISLILLFSCELAAVAAPNSDTPFMTDNEFALMAAAQLLPGGHQSTSLFTERALAYLAFKLNDIAVNGGSGTYQGSNVPASITFLDGVATLNLPDGPNDVQWIVTEAAGGADAPFSVVAGIASITTGGVTYSWVVTSLLGGTGQEGLIVITSGIASIFITDTTHSWAVFPV